MVLDANDHEVIAACQRGDRDAFQVLFETYQDQVYSIALRYSGDPAAALDIAQEIFLKLLSRIGDFRGEAGFETWLYRLVVNCCLDHRRRGRRIVELFTGVVDSFRAPAASAVDDLLGSELRAQVRSGVERLPPDQRMVVVLRYTEGLSYDQIAAILGCSAGTIASRLNRAHKTLERRLSHLRRGTA